MRKQNLRTFLSSKLEIGLLLLMILLIAPYYFFRIAVTELVRWLTRSPKLILREVEDTISSESHWFRQEVERFIPVGCPLVRAETILKRNGFKISKGREQGQPYLFAVKQKGYLRAFLLVAWKWHIYLTSADDGRITTMSCCSSILGV